MTLLFGLTPSPLPLRMDRSHGSEQVTSKFVSTQLFVPNEEYGLQYIPIRTSVIESVVRTSVPPLVLANMIVDVPKLRAQEELREQLQSRVTPPPTILPHSRTLVQSLF